jgi:hypothetical protein
MLSKTIDGDELSKGKGGGKEEEKIMLWERRHVPFQIVY